MTNPRWPWPLLALMWYYRRPQLGFWVLLCIAALWGLAASTGTATLLHEA